MENSTVRSGDIHYIVKGCRTGMSSRRERCLYVVLGIQLFMSIENKVWLALYRLKLGLRLCCSARKKKGRLLRVPEAAPNNE